MKGIDHLSVVIITYNEEEHLRTCLESVKTIADEILVLDSFSTDSTQAICLEYGVRFLEHPFDGYVSQKNRALGLAQYDWVLSLDGDEALSEEAIDTIQALKFHSFADAYLFNRRNFYCERWMRFTSLYPDRKLRLFNRTKGKWTGLDPHDRVQMVPGTKIHWVEGDLLHWVIRDQEDHRDKVEKFSTIAAQAYLSSGRKAGKMAAVSHSLWRFLSEYLLKAGFLEGRLGWQFSLLSAKYVFLKYKKLAHKHA